MAGTEANAINAATTGIVGNTGTSFTGTPVTQYNVITGASTSSTLNNVAPSATSGVPLVSNGSSSQPSFTTAVVAGGGTGDTSFTAYAPLCGGTTTTGALQSASTGISTSGYVLTSNGSSALPSFLPAPGAGAANLLNIQFFTSSGTYTPTSGMAYCFIECQGGGGGGGGCASTAGTLWGGGGGAGGNAKGFFAAATIGASQTVTINSGGAGNAGANGSAGGSVSVGAIISANGGGGGLAGSPYTGGAGGTATGGGLNATGEAGGISYQTADSSNQNYGADSAYGYGGQANYAQPSGVTVVGKVASGYGAGGGGASNAAMSTVAGGHGSAGFVVITEYS